MIAFEWDCRNVEAYVNLGTVSNFVNKVHWRLKAVSTELDSSGHPYSAVAVGVVSLPENFDNFIPYESLSNHIVTGWVIDELGSSAVEKIKNTLPVVVSLVLPG
jgi:hypothetical protein